MRRPRTVVTLSALGLSLAILALSFLGFLNSAENAATLPLRPLQDLLGGAGNQAAAFSQELAEVRQLRQRNRELEQALTNFQAEIAELRAFRSDYERLVELSHYVGQAGTSWRYVSADVIGRDLSGIARVIHINAGTRNGVSLGDPVVTPLGLVGRVRQVSATGAEVLLITDSASAVTARVLNPTNDSGVVRGTLNGELLLDFVDINAQISEAQQVYTTGETQAFPPNLLIGQLASVRLSEDGLFLQGTVESLVDFEGLQLVLVITDFEPVEIEIFQSTPIP